jgi:hypothetical protein
VAALFFVGPLGPRRSIVVVVVAAVVSVIVIVAVVELAVRSLKPPSQTSDRQDVAGIKDALGRFAHPFEGVFDDDRP